jgi:hypothetical protein
MFAPLIFVVAASTHGECTKPDFNGDGVIDHVDTVEDSCGTGGCVYDLSLANGRKLGRIDGLCSFKLERRKNKWADIVTWWWLGVDGVETRYRFDGRRYRQIAHHTYRAH